MRDSAVTPLSVVRFDPSPRLFREAGLSDRFIRSAGTRGLVNPLGLVLLALALVAFGGAWWAYKRRARMADTPTSKVRSMAIGPVELNGLSVVPPGGAALRAPFTGEPCVYWEYLVEEERTRTVTRVVNGKPQTHTERYWATVDAGSSPERFGLQDDTGVALVDPRGGDMPAPLVARFGSGFGRDPPPAVMAFLQRRGLKHETLFGLNKKMRYTERRLAAGTTLYVLGNAARRDDAPAAAGNDALVVQKQGDAPFLVSDKSEKQLTLRWTLAMWTLLVVGVVAAGAGAWLLGASA